MKVEVSTLGNGEAVTYGSLFKDNVLAPFIELVLGNKRELEGLRNERSSGIRSSEGSLAGTLAYYVVVNRGVRGSFKLNVGNGGVTLCISAYGVGEIGVSLEVSVNLDGDFRIVDNEVIVNGELNCSVVKLNLNKNVAALAGRNDVDVVAGEGEAVNTGLGIVAFLSIYGQAVGCDCSAVEKIDEVSKSAGVVRCAGKNAAGDVVVAVKELHLAGCGSELVVAESLGNAEYAVLARLLEPVLVSADKATLIEGLVEDVGVAVTENEVNLVAKVGLYIVAARRTAVYGLVCNDACINNLMVARHSRGENCKEVCLVNLSYLCSANGAVACSVNGVRLAVSYLNLMLAKSCVPVVVLIVGPLVIINVLVDILDDVVTNIALAVSILVCVVSCVDTDYNVTAGSCVPVLCAVNGPGLCLILVSMVCEGTEIACTVVVCVDVSQL